MIKKRFFGVLAIAFAACTAPTHISNEYFDLAKYFEGEVASLAKTNPDVDKTVIIDGKPETKTLKISDWKKEFSIFTGADINKAAWRGLFKVERTSSGEIYRSNDEKVAVKYLEIVRDDEEVKHIRAILERKNMVYTATDTLDYYPGSHYLIKKSEKIKLVGMKRYIVEGRIK